MLPVASILLSRTGLKIGMGVALALGAYSYHRSVVRNAQQEQEAETRATVQTELEAQHAIETKKYQERVSELEQRVVDLAKNKAAVVQRIEVITKQAEMERAEIPTLTDDAVLAAIRERLRAESAAPNAR